nr:MAG TPA: hypothetical protein [Caudoviricetes sp.]
MDVICYPSVKLIIYDGLTKHTLSFMSDFKEY